jgi:hypothetical protein
MKQYDPKSGLNNDANLDMKVAFLYIWPIIPSIHVDTASTTFHWNATIR